MTQEKTGPKSFPINATDVVTILVKTTVSVAGVIVAVKACQFAAATIGLGVLATKIEQDCRPLCPNCVRRTRVMPFALRLTTRATILLPIFVLLFRQGV